MLLDFIVLGVMAGLVSAAALYTHSQRDAMFDRLNDIPDKDIYY
jgi:hypothetical protein